MTKILMIDDRMTKGIIAGAIGAVVQNVYAYVASLFGLTGVLYVDIARAVLFHGNYTGTLAMAVSLTGHVIIDSLWGILYAYLIKYTTSRFYILKSIVFGGGIWFFVRVTGTKILKLPEFTGNDPATVMVFFIGAVLFGLTIAYVLKSLDISHEKMG